MMVKQYIRNKKRQRIGLITATIEGDKALIGYSKCNKEDVFCRDTGEIIANVRAKSLFGVKDLAEEVPHEIKKALPCFLKNHVRTLSGAKLPAWIGSVIIDTATTIK